MCAATREIEKRRRELRISNSPSRKADADAAQNCATTSDTSDSERAPLLRRREMPTHPKGLYVLYATELWERFSFYGMKALLVLCLNSGALSPERLVAAIRQARAPIHWGRACAEKFP